MYSITGTLVATKGASSIQRVWGFLCFSVIWFTAVFPCGQFQILFICFQEMFDFRSNLYNSNMFKRYYSRQAPKLLVFLCVSSQLHSSILFSFEVLDLGLVSISWNEWNRKPTYVAMASDWNELKVESFMGSGGCHTLDICGLEYPWISHIFPYVIHDPRVVCVCTWFLARRISQSKSGQTLPGGKRRARLHASFMNTQQNILTYCTK